MSELAYQFEVEDAITHEKHQMTVTSDQHGGIVEIEGVDRVIVLDVCAGDLRVFVGSREEDRVDPCPVAVLPLKGEANGEGQEIPDSGD
ncbi:hypothetical protein [Gimesia panareensis]|uniref:hypothetical protein n=1 Tax=Gimesia panareensis TaxID=2527978 RepID=UPI00118AF597|nr:hypothetical protein [Gimesia panareensis]QDU53109.1 hypothetical protein Pan110_54930 [Gimesia panareensis]